MRYGLAGKLAGYFIDSKLTPILIIVSIALGLFSVVTTPKEEEPQIVVPMIDIMISYPGATPEEVERRVVTPLEKKLMELKDIEYIYSASMEGMAVVTARFYVGTDPVKALVELNSKMMSALDLAPPGVILPPLIKPKSIDDVPILTLTLWGKNYNSYDLRRIAEALENELKKVQDVADVYVVGGLPRQIRILIDPHRLNAYKISPHQIAQIIQTANAQQRGGKITQDNREFIIRTGEFLKSKQDIENILIGFSNGRPVYLKDVAVVIDGPAKIDNYVFMGFGPQHGEKGINNVTVGELYPAVTLAISKRVRTNAVKVAGEVLRVVESLKGKVIPHDLNITVTRNYGETAKEKSNTLIKKLLIATFSVILLIAVTLGIREAIIVGIAVPVTLAIALFLSQAFGFTLNRVTLFALIFAIGILVDDAIVVVENIHRWFELKLAKNPKDAIVGATDEVGNPTILATFTVISALMPMAFVTGLMGPYMRPIPINASVAMFFSLLVAFIITPWASLIFLKRKFNVTPHSNTDIQPSVYRRYYTKIITPLLIDKKKRYLFYTFTLLLLLLSISLLITKIVTVKMLPYDNKNEIQIVIDMPDGTPLEKTLETTKAIADFLSKQSIVTDYQIYVGTSSPFNFNGLVRHYYLRKASNLADIQVNLIDKSKREEQSHDFAKRIRPVIHEIAQKYGAKYVAVVEVPPGPPVLSPIVAEIYGSDLEILRKFAKEVLKVFKDNPDITDEGIYLEDPAPLIRITLKDDKLKLAGLNKHYVVEFISFLFGGQQVGILQNIDTYHTPIIIEMDEKYKTLETLKTLKIPASDGRLIPLIEIADIKQDTIEPTIYHKNLRRVIYVIGDVTGREEAPFYGILKIREKIQNIPNPYGQIEEFWMSLPLFDSKQISVKWDGEMHITLEVFRDLGLAFAVALFIMYVLILGWFKDFRVPGIIMAPIPLTLVGIIPGHLLMNSFFTATSMIGFIALAGIIVRNSILIVDFSREKINQGIPVHLAIVEAGITRTRPILLTAVAIIVGSFVLIFDPIFNGLAISLIFGTIGSTVLTLILIPVMYYSSVIKRIRAEISPETIRKDLLGRS